MTLNKENLKRGSCLFLFWAWHLIFTILALFLGMIELAIPLFNSAVADNAPWHYLIFVMLIILLPFFSIFMAVKYFQQDHRLLMKYFYGFEMPLLFFLLVRVFTFRDDGLAVQWLMLNVVLGLGAWLVFLLIQQRDKSSTIPLKNSWLGTTGSTLLAGVGMYFGTIFLIMQLPNAVEFIAELTDAILGIAWDDVTGLLGIAINPLWWLFGFFILFTFSLFLVLPLAMIYLYIGQFLKRMKLLKSPLHLALALLIISINVAVFYSTTQQSQQQVLETLESTDQALSQSDLFAQRESIREGLLNAYLARYRYMSTNNLSQRIQRNYHQVFGISLDAAAVPQNIFNALLKPFLYDGKDWSDKQRAEKHYAEFFDAPIQKAERDLILSTIRRTWETSRSNEAGLLDAANHYVHLDKQSIDIKEAQNIATVTIQQTLSNRTYQARETVLHFALPEEAVLTGVWLSDDKADLLKYPYALAPKGAAQSVYKAEVNRRVDPALLEQVGPYQYRLRVYPVLARPRLGGEAGEPLYARFSYQTLADSQGNWPMPKILEKRNIFWDDETQFSVNGDDLYRSEIKNGFPIKGALPKSKSETSTIVFQVGEQQIHAISREKNQEDRPKEARFAVIIDGSYSMHTHYSDAVIALAELSQQDISFDSYFCQNTCQDFSIANNLKPPTFFGNSQTLQHLQAFSELKPENAYDAVIVLTDAGSYELADTDSKDALSINKPLWLVHLGDALPYAYDDKVLDTLYASKGGIASSSKEALSRYQLLSKGKLSPGLISPSDATLISISDQYLWFAKPTKAESAQPSSIAAAHWIRHLMRQLDTSKLQTLDQIHQIAKQNNIVTHYSSMLVLVNDRQKEALKKAESEDDRFEREVETGKQQTTNPNDPFAVPAVPEPEEWALIIIALMLLTYTMWKRPIDLTHTTHEHPEV